MIEFLLLVNFNFTVILLLAPCMLANKQDILFVERDDIQLISDSWQLVFDFKFDSLIIPLNQLKATLDDIKQSTNFFYGEMGNGFQAVADHLTDEVINTFQAEAVQLISRVQEFAEPIASSRAVRGFINGLGEGLHWLAGVATDEQVKHFDAHIEQLEVSNRKITHVLKHQITYFNQSIATMHQHEKIMRKLSTGVAALTTTIEHYINRTRSQYSTLDHRTRVLATITSVTVLSQHALQTIRSEILSYASAQEAAIQGRLSIELIKPHDLLTAVQHIHRHLPDKLSLLAHPTKKNIPLFYSTARVRCVTTEKGLRFYVNIPTRDIDRVFKIHEVYGWPQLSTEKNKATIIIPEVPYLGVSKDNMQFILLPNNYETQCQLTQPIMCAPTFPILTRTAPSCIVSAFLKDSSAINKYCKIMDTETSFLRIVKGSKQGEWLYSCSENVTFSVDCVPEEGQTDGSSTWLSIRGQGTITLNKGCSANHQAFILMGPTVTRSNEGPLTLENTITITNNFSFQNPKQLNMDAYNGSLLDHNMLLINASLNELPSDQSRVIKEEKLSTDLYNLNSTDEELNENFPLTHIAVGTSGSGIMIAAAFVVTCLYLRRRRREQSPHPTPICIITAEEVATQPRVSTHREPSCPHVF